MTTKNTTQAASVKGGRTTLIKNLSNQQLLRNFELQVLGLYDGTLRQEKICHEILLRMWAGRKKSPDGLMACEDMFAQ